MDFLLKIKIGWIFVFASFKLWCNYMTDKSASFWLNCFYHFDKGSEEMKLTWSNYEIAMKNQKKPRGRAKPKYSNTITGFLKWKNEHLCSV